MLTETEKETLAALSALALKNNTVVRVVGGAVRDSLLGYDRPLKDIDLVISGDARDFARQAADYFSCEFKVFDDFLTAKLIGLPAVAELDLASLRQEHYVKPGALPTASLGNFEQDCQRRDFSINALYIGLRDFIESPGNIAADLVVDLTGGLADLRSRLVRILHEKSFIDDPTRLFRAIRYHIKIEGSMEKQTRQLFEESVKNGALATISKQRILAEIARICGEQASVRMLSEIAVNGVLYNSQLLSLAAVDNFLKLISGAENSLTFDSICRILYFLEEAGIRRSKYSDMGFGKKFFKTAELAFDQFRVISESR